MFGGSIIMINQYGFVLDLLDIEIGLLFKMFVKKCCLAKRNKVIGLLLMVLHNCNKAMNCKELFSDETIH